LRGGVRQEGLEVVLDQRVERRGGGIAAAVDGDKAVGARRGRRMREGTAGCGPAGAGMLSLALLVIRLFAYDLANVDTGVGIILFLAIGFGFLGLSYLFRGRQPAA
jgi:hypothetical protein